MNTSPRGQRDRRSADPTRELVDKLLADDNMRAAVARDYDRNRARILEREEQWNECNRATA